MDSMDFARLSERAGEGAARTCPPLPLSPSPPLPAERQYLIWTSSLEYGVEFVTVTVACSAQVP